MRWRTFWLFVGGLGLVDALALGGWTALSWGLRGASHDGTPEIDVAHGQWMIVALLGTALVAHLALAGWGIARKRSEAWIASIAAAVLFPVSLPIGIVLVGGALRLFYG